MYRDRRSQMAHETFIIYLILKTCRYKGPHQISRELYTGSQDKGASYHRIILREDSIKGEHFGRGDPWSAVRRRGVAALRRIVQRHLLLPLVDTEKRLRVTTLNGTYPQHHLHL